MKLSELFEDSAFNVIKNEYQNSGEKINFEFDKDKQEAEVFIGNRKQKSLPLSKIPESVVNKTIAVLKEKIRSSDSANVADIIHAIESVKDFTGKVHIIQNFFGHTDSQHDIESNGHLVIKDMKEFNKTIKKIDDGMKEGFAPVRLIKNQSPASPLEMRKTVLNMTKGSKLPEEDDDPTHKYGENAKKAGLGVDDILKAKRTDQKAKNDDMIKQKEEEQAKRVKEAKIKAEERRREHAIGGSPSTSKKIVGGGVYKQNHYDGFFK